MRLKKLRMHWKQLSLQKKHHLINMFSTHKSELSFLVIWNTNQVTETYSGATENHLNKDSFLDSLIVPVYRGKKMFAIILIPVVPVTLSMLSIH